MRREPVWVTAEQVVALNRSVVAATGEPHGINIVGAVEAAVSRPIQHFFYGPADTQDDTVLLGTKLCVGLSQSQAFAQGNKRTALAAMTMFLNLNGYELSASEPGRLAELILATAAGDRADRLSEDRFADLLDPLVIEVHGSVDD